MRRLLLIPAFISGLCFVSSALAATLEPVRGQVSINHGDGFQRVAGTVEARVGDLVMAGKGGSAKLVYSDGCVIKVKPGTVVRVGRKSPCKAKYAVEGDPNTGFVENLGEYAIGTGAAFLLFCLHASQYCDDDDGGRRRAQIERPASP
jgi:hypothetical protein